MNTDRRLNESRHRLLNDSRHMVYHLTLVSLSASIALSMPALVRAFADRFHDYRAQIESDSFTLIGTEIAIVLCLLSFFNVAGRSL